MTPTYAECSEWSRAAKALYARGCNAEAHLLSACAAKDDIPIKQFDRVSEVYRVWVTYDEPKAPK